MSRPGDVRRAGVAHAIEVGQPAAADGLVAPKGTRGGHCAVGARTGLGIRREKRGTGLRRRDARPDRRIRRAAAIDDGPRREKQAGINTRFLGRPGASPVRAGGTVT